MRKTVHTIFICLFLALCLVPSLGMLLFGESAAGANEVLASRPRWGWSVLSETGDYTPTASPCGRR